MRKTLILAIVPVLVLLMGAKGCGTTNTPISAPTSGPPDCSGTSTTLRVTLPHGAQHGSQVEGQISFVCGTAPVSYDTTVLLYWRKYSDPLNPSGSGSTHGWLPAGKARITLDANNPARTGHTYTMTVSASCIPHTNWYMKVTYSGTNHDGVVFPAASYYVPPSAFGASKAPVTGFVVGECPR